MAYLFELILISGLVRIGASYLTSDGLKRDPSEVSGVITGHLTLTKAEPIKGESLDPWEMIWPDVVNMSSFQLVSHLLDNHIPKYHSVIFILLGALIDNSFFPIVRFAP